MHGTTWDQVGSQVYAVYVGNRKNRLELIGKMAESGPKGPNSLVF